MNHLIETLNWLGVPFLNSVWPMLWQSSLLIALVLAMDLLLGRKIRASVRHALWLVVLVKLLLPPSLALPTGPTWWLFPAQPPVKAAAAEHFTLTYDTAAPAPAFVLPAVPFAELPAPKLDRAGWTLLAAGAVSAGLLLWLLIRWAQVLRMVRRASLSPELSQPSCEARRLAGLRGPVRVRAVDTPMSPAVCGLFRPVILLPRTLAEQLSAEQLRAVLLHEAIHIRRKDIWVNCAQSLLQIVYWWHPLVWLANARIRRVREEAVDDAVMLALDAGAEIYAPTLLEVARLALRRPLLSLGLVGIMESRSALRQRIERLVAFRAPRQAGLTLASLCGIFVFSAVALPMGEGPAPARREMVADASPPLRGVTPPATVAHTNPPAVLVAAEIYQMGPEELKNFVSDLTFNRGRADEDAWWSAPPEEFNHLLSHLKNSGFTPRLRPRIQTSSGKEADFFVGNDTHGTELDCLSVAEGGQVNLAIHGQTVDASDAAAVTNRFQVTAWMENHAGLVIPVPGDVSNAVVFLWVEILTNQPSASLQPRLRPVAQPRSSDAALDAPVFTGPGRQAIMAKLGEIHFGEVSYNGLPLREVLKQLSGQCRLRDPEGKGINFLINPNPGLSSQPATASSAADRDAMDVGSFMVRIPSLTDVRLADVLDAIVLVADHPIKYSVQDFGIVFSSRDSATSPFSVGTFRVDPNTFYSGLEEVSAESFGAVQNNGTAGGGGGQNQNNGAVVGVVNAFPGAGGLRNTGQGAGAGVGGGQGSGSLLNNAGAGGGGDNGLAPAASVSGLAPQTTVTFRLNDPKPEADLKKLLLDAGVKMPPTTFIYNAKAGLFAVRGTPDQLALVHRTVLKLNGYSPQDIQSNDLGFVKRLNANPTAIQESTNLFMRTFRVDPKTFDSALDVSTSSVPSVLARALFTKLGVDFLKPAGKAIFFNDRLGYLFVKATASDLDTIERGLEVLKADQAPPQRGIPPAPGQGIPIQAPTPSQAPPQLHLKARFYEVPKGTLAGFDNFLRSTNVSGGGFMGILTGQNAKVVREALQSRPGMEVLAEPEITLFGGRQAQIRATQVQTIVTNVMWKAVETNQYGGLQQNAIVPQTGGLETGPVLDALPQVLADGYTITLSTKASLTEFFGYTQPKDKSGRPLTRRVRDSAGGETDVPLIWPMAEVRSRSAKVNLYDGQTLVLSLNQAPAEPIVFSALDPAQAAAVANAIQEAEKKKGEKEVLVFITPTLVDATDRRIHSDDEMPFAQEGIPPQISK